ncbi:lipid asymmetry maintenance protein MlaB [Neptuniibacter sp. SY11_33]|uniref:STAS domain-containing protein n=1 Tax=Neptuniibacter sp. SY11_33 TaxID=3398215 RepID=UPI0039F517BB
MDANSVLAMPEELSIANVTEWQQKLGSYINSAEAVCLDGEKLTRVDTAALQLLTAFCLKAQTLQKTVKWINPSDTLVKTACQLGLEQTLFLKND